ncbi:pyridoxal phosphate-dependent aminotransferase [candidate division NPL-UPA2 bacterium]|nr:pyridoxal phosphate-dependent aminotransferase [candidate division NPL-UPA2 bacterium]
MSLSKRAALTGLSPTLAITAKAKEMKSQGIDVVEFGAGEPDFDTPEHIKEEAGKALQEGFTKYTSASGIEPLKEAICNKLKEDNELNYEPAQIIVSCGAKHSLYNAIQIICEEEDEVILPSPYWVSYPEQIKLSGARAVYVETGAEDDFKISSEKFLKKITSRTKLLVLNSPHNPTGAVYDREELMALAEIAVEENIYVISDEIYEKIIYDEAKHVSIASLNPRIKDLTVVINGVSKSYSMTGWRIGYAAGSKEIIAAMSRLQSHSTSNPNSIAQRAAVKAISGTQEPLKKMLLEFKGRRDYLVERLNNLKGFSCRKPQGAFYVFLNISEVLGKDFQGRKVVDSSSLTELLLDEARVAVVPGSAFGQDNYLRFSYATSMENIAKGLDRIEEVVDKIV